jgi:hypothetical protein
LRASEGIALASRQLSERTIEAACAVFALWTLCSHAAVFAGGSLRALLALFAAALLAAAGLRAWLLRAGAAATSPAAPAPAPAAPAPAADSAFARRLRLALGAAGGVAALTLDPRQHPIALWCALLGVLGVAAAFFLVREAPSAEPPRRSRAAEPLLWGLALACALYALAVHRPDQDDAFYVNVAVAAVDHPELPLLARDTLHGHFEWPIHLPSYRLHSYELAVAALTLLTGAPAIYVFHLLASALAALCVPLAHAQLFRLLAPRVWLAATAALVLVLALPGDTHRWYGNFAFVRIWQGKSILLSVALPLVAAAGLRFALAPTRAGWLRLAAAQIAALGASASGLWLGPAVALTAQAAVLRPRARDLGTLGLGALASAYPIAAALAQRAGMRERAPHLAERFAPGEQLGRAFTTVLGDSTLVMVGVAALFLAWACWGRGLARRFAIAAPLAAALVLLAPWADAFVRANLTGPSFWRALWAVPIPILIALVGVAPLQWPGARGRAAAAALWALFAFGVPGDYGFGAGNAARLGWPGLKVPPDAYGWAERIQALAPGQPVLAPPRINSWIPTFHGHAFPLAVRFYLTPLREVIGEREYRERLRLVRLADGEPAGPAGLQAFAEGLERHGVRLVCLRRSEHAPPLRALLRRAGFRRQVVGTRDEIWLRETPQHPGAAAP